MEYNKKQFHKANDKKVLHKVKKHWIVVSMALLMAIGGKAITTHVSAHADVNSSHDQTNNINTVKDELNQKLVQAQGNSQPNQNQQAQSNGSAEANQESSVDYMKQASELHEQILRNAGASLSRANSNDTNSQTSNGRQQAINNNQSNLSNTPQNVTDDQAKARRLLGDSQTVDVTYHYTFGGQPISIPDGTKNVTVSSSDKVNSSNFMLPEAKGYQVDYSDQDSDLPVTMNGGKYWVNVPVDRYSRWGGNYQANADQMAPWYLQPDGNLIIGSGTLSLGQDSWDGTQSDRNMVTSIHIPGNKSVTAEGISSDFADFPNLETVDVSGLDTTQTSDFNNAFANDPKLITIIGLSDLNITNKAISVSGMFDSDNNLTQVNLPNMQNNNIDDFSGMFKNDANLKYIKGLSDLNTSHATNMSEMFENNNVSDLDLGNFDTRNVSDFSDFVGDDPQLNTVTIGNNSGRFPVGYYTVDEGQSSPNEFQHVNYAGAGFTGAWQNSSNGQTYNGSDISNDKVTLPAGTYKKNVVPTIFTYYKWFSNKPVHPINGQSGYITPNRPLASDANQIPDISNYEVGNISDKNNPNLGHKVYYDIHKYQVANTGDSNDGHGNYLSTQNVSDLPNQKYSIPVVSSKEVGYGYDGTSKYELDNRGLLRVSGGTLAGPLSNYFKPDNDDLEARSVRSVLFNTKKPTMAPADASNLFAGLPNVETIDLHGLNTHGVTKMAGMFHANSDRTLQNIKGLNDLDTSQVSDMHDMFKDTGLNNVNDLTNWNVSNVTNLNSDFRGDDNLSNWQPIYNAWKFNNQPSVTNMFNQSLANNGNDPQVTQHALDNNKWEFPPSIIRENFTYYNWITGATVGNQQSADIFPGVAVRSDANQIPSVSGYQLADDGDDDNNQLSNNYLPSDSVEVANSTYNIPVVPNNITNYGFDGSDANNDAKYTLDNNGTMQFYGGSLSKPINEVAANSSNSNFTSRVKRIQFAPNSILSSNSSDMFAALPNLSDFDQTNLNGSSDVLSGSKMFSSDPSLKALNISDLHLALNSDGGVPHIFNNVFANDPNLSYVNMKSFVTHNANSSAGLFSGDYKLQELTLSAGNPTYMDSSSNNRPAFFNGAVFSDGSYSSDNTASSAKSGNYYIASPVRIHFVDQNGVSQDSGYSIYLPNNLSSYRNGYHGKISDQIKTLINDYGLSDPNYTIVNPSSPQQDYTVHNPLGDNAYVDVKVIGKNDVPEINHGQVQVVYENADGSTQGQPGNGTPVKLPLTLNGRNSDVIACDPANWVPKGYYLDINSKDLKHSKTHPSDFVAKITSNGQFKWVRVTNPNKRVVTSDSTSYLPTFYVKAETATNNPDPNKHQISVPTATVNQILEAYDGHIIGTDTQEVQIAGDVGSVYTLKNSSLANLGGYTLDTNPNLHGQYNNENGNLTGRIMVNPNGNAYLTNPIEDLYYIKSIPTQILVHFINQAGHEVHSTLSAPQYDGTKLDLSGNSKIVTESMPQIPHYTYDQAANQAKGISTATFGDHNQDAYVYVTGKPETVPVQYVYNNGNTHKTVATTSIPTTYGDEVVIPNHIDSVPNNVYMWNKSQNSLYRVPYVQNGSDTNAYIVNLDSRRFTVPVQFMHNGQSMGPTDYSTHGLAYDNVTLPNAPEGYHYDKASDQSYQITPTPSDNPTNIQSDGNLQTDRVKIDSDLARVHVQYLNQNDQVVQSSDTSGNDHVGHLISFTAPKGYRIKGNDSYTFKPQDAVAKATDNPNNTVNVYLAGNTSPINAPIYVQYENYNSDNRGARQSDTVKLNFDGEVNNQYTFWPSSNTVNNSNHQNLVPAGYSIDYKAGKTSHSYTANVNSDNNIVWDNEQPTVYIKADQSKNLANHTLNVTQIEESPSGQIMNTKEVSQPLSDLNVGDTYNVSDNNYTHNPWLKVSDYHLAQGSEPNASVNPANNKLTGQVTANGLTNNHATLYYVADPANNLTVDYKIHGMNGSSDTQIGSHVYSGYYGEKVNGFDSIPKAYHLDKSNTPLNTQFTLGPSQSDKTIYVLPYQVNDRTVNVNAKLEDPNGNQIMQANGQPANVIVPVTVNVNSRDQFTITPSDNAFNVSPLVNVNNVSGFVPYQNSDISGYITPVGPRITSHNKGTFVYRAKADPMTTGSMNIEFINQNGQFVNDDGTVASNLTQYSGYTVPNAYYDETVNVNQTPGIPTGYQLANNQPLDYTFNGRPQTNIVRVNGKSITNSVHVNIFKEDPYGKNAQLDQLPKPNPSKDADSDAFKVTGRVGDTFTYGNSDFRPNSYLFDPNNSPYISATVTILPNGHLQINQNKNLNPGQYNLEFYYYLNAPTTGLSPITVNYESTDYTTDNNGHKIHNTMTKVIDPSDITEPYEGKVIPDVIHASKSINMDPPKGYTLEPDQDTRTVLSTHPSFVTLWITPDKSQGQGDNDSNHAQPIRVIYKRRDNHKWIGSAFYVEGDMDQNVNVINDANHPVPQGYQLINPQKLDYRISNVHQTASVYIMPNRNSADDYYNNIRVITPDNKLIRQYRSKPQTIQLNHTITVNPVDVSDVTTDSSGNHLTGQEYKLVGSSKSFNVTDQGGYLTAGPHTLTYQARSDNHGKINVQYYDDDNNDTLIPNAGGTINHGYDGEAISAKQIASDTKDHVNVPSDYALDGNQTQSYVISPNTITAKLYIHGDQTVKSTSHITLNEYDPYNQKLIASPTVSDVITGTVGDSYKIDPNDYLPKGYQLDNPKYSAQNHTYSGVLNKNGVSDNSKNIQYYYQLPSSTTQNLQPINVRYVDGGYLIANRSINPKNDIDYAGKKVNDVTAEAGLPKGYQVSPTSQNLSAVFGHTVQYVTVNVQTSSNKTNGTFFIINNLYNHDGSKLVQTKTKAIAMNGTIGTKSDIAANEFPAPQGYQNVENPHVATVDYTPNGLSQNSTTYNYVSDAAQPINVIYLNNGTKVGSTSISKYKDQPLYMTEPVDVAQNVPKGYQLNGNQKTLYNVTNQPQPVYLNVSPVKATSKFFDLTIVRKSPSGDQIKGLPKLKVPVRLTIPIGKSVTITPDNFKQYISSDDQQLMSQQLAGFNPVRNQSVLVRNGRNHLMPSADSFAYVSNSDVQPITVNYYNQHGQLVKHGQINSGYFDETIPDVSHQVTLPKGYRLMPNINQQLSYVMNKQPQTANLMVLGDVETYPVKVDIYENGTYHNSVNDNVHGYVGDSDIVDANNFVPQGYDVAKNGQLIKVPVSIGDSGVNPTDVKFYYVADPADQVKPIYVTYINQDGKVLVKNQKLQGTYGDSVDVYNATKSDLNDRSDHHPLYQLDMSDKNGVYNYKYNGNNQYATIMVTGVPVINRYHIERHLFRYIESDISDNVPNVQTIHGHIGDTVTVIPSEYTPKGYQVDSDDRAQSFVLNSDQTTVHPVKFNYDLMPVTNHVIFKDSTSHQQVGEEDIKGLVGRFIRWTDYYDFVPYGYKYVGNGHQNVSIVSDDSNDPNVVYVKSLHDRPAPQPAMHAGDGVIKINYVDNADHSKVINTLTLVKPVNNNFRMIDYAGTNSLPSGYQWTHSDASSTNHEMTYHHVYRFSDQPQQLNIYVTKARRPSKIARDYVEYRDVDHNDQQVGRTRIISDRTGDQIDYDPYTMNLPTGYSFESLGSHDSTYEPNRTEVIYVQPATNKVQYGIINVVYRDIANGDKKISSYIQSGRAGRISNIINDAVNMVPTGYEFNKISNPVYQFNNQTQTMDIDVQPVQMFGAINVNYVDINSHHLLDTEQVTGQVGDVFNIAPYEIDLPVNYRYAGTSNNIPLMFTRNPASIKIYVKKSD